MWPFKNKRQKELDTLAERVYALEFNIRKQALKYKACTECGFVKSGAQFLNEDETLNTNPDTRFRHFQREVCNGCLKTVATRNKAIEYAKENPSAVLKCEKENE